MLDVATFDPAHRRVHVTPVVGPHIRVPVEAIDVCIEMTDEVALFVRRTVSRRMSSDTRWDPPY